MFISRPVIRGKYISVPHMGNSLDGEGGWDGWEMNGREKEKEKELKPYFPSSLFYHRDQPSLPQLRGPLLHTRLGLTPIERCANNAQIRGHEWIVTNVKYSFTQPVRIARRNEQISPQHECREGVSKVCWKNRRRLRTTASSSYPSSLGKFGRSQGKVGQFGLHLL